MVYPAMEISMGNSLRGFPFGNFSPRFSLRALVRFPKMIQPIQVGSEHLLTGSI